MTTAPMSRSLPLVLAVALAACQGDAAPPPTSSPEKSVKEMSVAELEDARAARPEAAGELGQRYYFGRGVERALGRAADLFKEAAARGDVGSMHNLAVMLQHGQGMPKDEAAAFGWFLRAAEGGHAEAAKFAGMMYKLGVGTTKDPVEALRWLEKSGSPQVYGSIADLHFRGEGIPRDYQRAREWWLKAARNGDGVAYARLALLYEDGLGVAPDPREADRWRRLASATSTGEAIVEALLKDWESADPEALFGFGLFLEQKGQGGDAEVVIRRAAAAGSERARAWLDGHGR